MDLPAWAVANAERREHIQRVADLLDAWAQAMQVPRAERGRWRRAAMLHDALKDAPDAELRALAPDAWDVDALRHGPAAANLAARHGERDRGVLDAVRFHSVGYAGWDQVGRMLYAADFLEPGRGFDDEERARLAAHLPADPEGVLRTVAAQRIAYLRRQGLAPLPETVAFHAALQCGAA